MRLIVFVMPLLMSEEKEKYKRIKKRKFRTSFFYVSYGFFDFVMIVTGTKLSYII